MKDLAIAVDLGGTNVRCSVIERHGQVLHEARESSQAGEGVDAVIARIAGLIDKAASAHDLAPAVAVGVAAPGPLDPQRGIVRYAPNLPGWDEVPLRDRLMELTGRKVIIGNDANVQALGEFHFGAARDVQNLVYIALGTGFGGGVISGGRLVDGASGMAAELGHTTVNFAGPRCSCGSLGCVEAYCSGWAIAQAGQGLAATDRSAALTAISQAGSVSAEDVAAAALAGDQAAARVIETAGCALGAALGNFVNVFNPEMIVIGGGLADIGAPLLDPAWEWMHSYALHDLAAEVQLRRSELGDQTGLYGAAALVFHQSKQERGIV